MKSAFEHIQSMIPQESEKAPSSPKGSGGQLDQMQRRAYVQGLTTLTIGLIFRYPPVLRDRLTTDSGDNFCDASGALGVTIQGSIFAREN